MASNQWRHGLCDCCGDCKQCCCVCCCPCIVFGQTAEKVGKSCPLYGLSLFVPVLDVLCLCMVRGDIRHKHNIEGSPVSDFLTVCCCSCCALIQMSRQVKADEPPIVITTTQQETVIVQQPWACHAVNDVTARRRLHSYCVWRRWIYLKQEIYSLL